MTKIRQVVNYDLIGQAVPKQTALSSEGVDVSHFQVGVYIMKITLESAEVHNPGLWSLGNRMPLAGGLTISKAIAWILNSARCK